MSYFRWFAAYVYVFSFVVTQSYGEALPVPRFVSLRSNLINMHVGPGNHYPVSWQYVRQSLPVEIIAEFDTWRQIRDCHGTEGWVHKSLLSGKRYAWVLSKIRKLYRYADAKSSVVAQVEPGVVGRVLECKSSWCRVEIKAETGKVKGWIRRQALWGVYPQETAF